MKTILSCCLVIILAVSCQMKQNQNSDESIDENMSVDNTETCMVDTVKATAIFWIDKAEAKHCKDSGLRTIKAKVYSIILINSKFQNECWKAGIYKQENNSFSFAVWGRNCKLCNNSPDLFPEWKKYLFVKLHLHLIL